VDALPLDSVPHGVFGAADGILDFAGSLVGLAFGLQLLITGDFACGFLDGAACLLHRTFNTIFIHWSRLLSEKAAVVGR
jgi:hypothetical protein